MHRSIIITLLFTSSLFAQIKINTYQQLTEQATPTNDTLFLRVQRPDKDTIRTIYPRYRIAACTRPDAKAFVNGEQTKVYSSGAFVGFVAVRSGINVLRFTVKSPAGDSLWKEFVLIRPEPAKNLPHDTLVIEQADEELPLASL